VRVEVDTVDQSMPPTATNARAPGVAQSESQWSVVKVLALTHWLSFSTPPRLLVSATRWPPVRTTQDTPRSLVVHQLLSVLRWFPEQTQSLLTFPRADILHLPSDLIPASEQRMAVPPMALRVMSLMSNAGNPALGTSTVDTALTNSQFISHTFTVFQLKSV